jgi:hypothetical protein
MIAQQNFSLVNVMIDGYMDCDLPSSTTPTLLEVRAVHSDVECTSSGKAGLVEITAFQKLKGMSKDRPA